MRRRNKNTDEFVHGWRLIYALRDGRSSTRGDMTAIDPRDGQKIFSLIGVKRKLDCVEEVFEEAIRRGQEAAGVFDEGGRKRKRHGGLDLWEESYPVDRGARRARTVVNYAEAHNASSVSGLRVSDLLLSALDEHSSKVTGALGNDSWFAGVDVLTLAAAVHAKQRRQLLKPPEHVPLGNVRHAISVLLRSGRLRRRLASTAMMAKGSTAYMLKMLVLNTLQVENDDAAPWSLPPLSKGGDGEGSRSHVWKGVTPYALASTCGASLVGRKVEVWWPGDACFYPARVTGFNERERATGYEDGAKGTHVLLYADGMRAIEHLEGAGEPQLWRLLPDDGSEYDLPEEEYDPCVPLEDEDEEEEEDDDDAPPPRMVTIRGPKGCMPVGSIGTAAYEARAEARAAAAEVSTGALVGRNIEVLWPIDRIWYPAEVLDFIVHDGTYMIEYMEDGEQEYLDLNTNDWREMKVEEAAKMKQRAALRVEAARRVEAAAAAAEGSSSTGAAGEAGEAGWSDRSLKTLEASGSTEVGTEVGTEAVEEVVEAEVKAEVKAEADAEVKADAEASRSEEPNSAADANGQGPDGTKPEGEGEGGGGGSAPADGGGADEWRGKGSRMEAAISLSAIKAQLPISSLDSAEFARPPGWFEYVSQHEKRHIASRWIREAKTSDGQDAAVTGRAELEEVLEEEGRAAGTPWLGQLGADGVWEIRGRSVGEALEWVVGELVAEGLVRCISGEDVGKGTGPLFSVANLYVRGEPFPRAKKAREDDEEEEAEEEEELCDFEVQRQRNIARNQELLRQLGLA